MERKVDRQGPRVGESLGAGEATNLVFERDGGIDFQIGMLDQCEPVWKIGGHPVEDWKALP